jgi:predicted component of type VI protein secretion system
MIPLNNTFRNERNVSGYSLKRDVRNDIREILNSQNVNGKSRPYQAKQLMNIVEKYNLEEDD